MIETGQVIHKKGRPCNRIKLNITDFIIKSKIRDAKRLLRYSNRSLSEISTHLCFSSQAYFQTVFKKSTGMTPNEYRNVHNEK